MAHTRELQETIVREITDRIDPDESSVPYSRDGYYHYHRFEAGKEYPVHCRRKQRLDASEEVLIDGNLLAEGHDFFSLRLGGTSPDQRVLAYAVDTRGRRIYSVYFKDLERGELLDDVLEEVTGNVAWASDNRTIFYTRQHPETLRSYQVFRHRLGTDPKEDVLIYEERDETFYVRVARTKSRRFVLIVSAHALTTEYRFVEADRPGDPFVLLQPREKGHEYRAHHEDEHFFILTNREAKNFRLVKAPVSAPAAENWEEIVPHREDVFLEDLEVFRDFLVLVERRSGLRRLRVIPRNGSPEHDVAFDEPAYYIELGENFEVEQKRPPIHL